MFVSFVIDYDELNEKNWILVILHMNLNIILIYNVFVSFECIYSNIEEIKINNQNAEYSS